MQADEANAMQSLWTAQKKRTSWTNENEILLDLKSGRALKLTQLNEYTRQIRNQSDQMFDYKSTGSSRLIRGQEMAGIQWSVTDT